jgi:hypothetical protein
MLELLWTWQTSNSPQSFQCLRLGAKRRNRGTCETTPASGVRTLQVLVLPTAGRALRDWRPATGPALW